MKKLSLAEQHRPMVYANTVEDSLLAGEYEREYERLRRDQAEFESPTRRPRPNNDDDDDEDEYNRIEEITSSLESLVDEATTMVRATTPVYEEEEGEEDIRRKNRRPAAAAMREKSSREILDSITRRVIMSQSGSRRRRRAHSPPHHHERDDTHHHDDDDDDELGETAAPPKKMPLYKPDDLAFRLNSFWSNANEKAHFIDTSSFYQASLGPDELKLKLAALTQHQKRRIINYNKLLECLS